MTGGLVGIGTDLVDLDRFRAVLARRPGLIERLFTDGERDYAERRGDPLERYAVRFAAKEAVLKALGVGLGAASWHEIEVERDPDGRPSLRLTGRAAELAAGAGVADWKLTLTHGDAAAQAIAVALGPPSWPAPGRPAGEWERMASDPLLDGGLVPIVTPEEMGAIDRAAPEPVRGAHRPGRSGHRPGRDRVCSAAPTGAGSWCSRGRATTATTVARRPVASGPAACGCTVVDAASAPDRLPDADLVVDAAYGTGFRGDYAAPAPPPGAAVLAVDIPSGVDGLTGRPSQRVLAADATVTFAALKPGLVLPPGLELAGEVEVADIGLDVSRATAHLVGAAAVAGWLPQRPAVAHKWQSAVWVVAGSPGMGGAAVVVRLGRSSSGRRLRAGVHARRPGGRICRSRRCGSTFRRRAGSDRSSTASTGSRRWWSATAWARHRRRPPPSVRSSPRRPPAACRRSSMPTASPPSAARRRRSSDRPRCSRPTTASSPASPEPPPGDDRIAAARSLAARTGAVVLLKGRATVVAAPGGSVLVTTTGDARLATAGTGDVLAGIIGALLATGMSPGACGRGGSVPPRSGRRPRLAPRPGGRRPADRPARRPRRGGRPAALNHGPRPGGPMLLRDLPVRDLMVTEVLSFRADENVQDAMRALVTQDIDAGPVVDDEGYVVGMLSTGDLIVEEANSPSRR